MNCGVCWFSNTTDSLAFTELLSAWVGSVQTLTVGIDSRYLILQSILFTFFDTLHYITFCHVAFHQLRIECCITSCDMMTDSLTLPLSLTDYKNTPQTFRNRVWGNTFEFGPKRILEAFWWWPKPWVFHDNNIMLPCTATSKFIQCICCHVFVKIFKCVIKIYNGPQKQFLYVKQYAEN